jgi:hypothetical protein
MNRRKPTRRPQPAAPPPAPLDDRYWIGRLEALRPRLAPGRTVRTERRLAGGVVETTEVDDAQAAVTEGAEIATYLMRRLLARQMDVTDARSFLTAFIDHQQTVQPMAHIPEQRATVERWIEAGRAALAVLEGANNDRAA